MISIAIVDDNKNDIDKITDFLEKVKKEENIEMKITTFFEGSKFIESSLDSRYNIVFMDIYLNELYDSDEDGIYYAQKFIKNNDNSLIIFVTTSEDDVWRAIETHICFNYIRKQYMEYSHIKNSIISAVEKIFDKENCINFFSGKNNIIIKSSKIKYILSDNKYTNIVFKNGVNKRYRVKFSDIHEELKYSRNFILCNRGILLNMDYVKTVTKESFIMIDDKILPIRLRDRSAILNLFYNYQFYLLNE